MKRFAPRIFKILLFFLAFSVINCEKETLNGNLDSIDPILKIEKINFEVIKQNTVLTEKLEFFKRIESKNLIDPGIQARNVYSEKHGFTVNTDNATYIESGEYHSYTFLIIRDEQNDLIENLLLSLNEDGLYDSYLIKYDLSSNQIMKLVNGQFTSVVDKLTTERIELDVDEMFFGRIGYNSDGTCYEVTETTGPLGFPVEQIENGVPCPDEDNDSENITGDPSDGGGGPNDNGSGNTGGDYDPNDETNGGSNGDSTGDGGSNSNSSDNNIILTSPHIDAIAGLLTALKHQLSLEEKNWVSFAASDAQIVNLFNFIVDNEYSEASKIAAVKTIKILAGIEDTSILANSFESISFTGLLGSMITSTNPDLFPEHMEAWNDIDPDNQLSFFNGDWTLITAKAYQTFITINDIENISTLIALDQLDAATQSQIAQNSLFISFLPNVKTIIGPSWPQNNEQWEAVGTIMGQYLLEIGLAIIPGSGIIDAVEGAQTGDYVTVAFGLATVVADFFGGVIIKLVAKIGKVAYKTFKIFKLAIKYLHEIVTSINSGFTTFLDGVIVRIKNEFGFNIAKIVDNVLTFEYPWFGGDIVTNPNKTTTVIGKFYDVVNGGGINKIKESGLYKYGENIGGINILDETYWSWPVNEAWLIDSINRGDVIRVVSNPYHNANLWEDGIVGGTRSTFGMEVDLLESLGYTFNSLNFTYSP